MTPEQRGETERCYVCGGSGRRSSWINAAHGEVEGKCPDCQGTGRLLVLRETSHYGVIVFSGDPSAEHPDEELHGSSPSMTFIACGSRDFCWQSLVKWTDAHPLRMWEEAEVLARDMAVVRSRQVAAEERSS